MYANAVAHNLLPPESGIDEEKLVGMLETLSARGGETTPTRAHIVAAYAFPGEPPPPERERCVRAFAPHELEAGMPGESRKFVKGAPRAPRPWAEAAKAQGEGQGGH